MDSKSDGLKPMRQVMDEAAERSELIRSVVRPSAEDKARMDAVTQRIRQEEQQEREELHPLLYTQSYTNLTKLDIRNKTFALFKRTPEMEAAFKALDAWTPSKEHGLLLYGRPGTGKTHLLKALCVRWASPTVRAHFETVSEAVQGMRDQLDDGKLADVMRRFVEPRVLVLDDLGAEGTTDWMQEQLLTLLERRMRSGRVTFMSSNIDMREKAARARYDERLLDRLMEQMVFVRCDGPSHRREIYARNKAQMEDKDDR